MKKKLFAAALSLVMAGVLMVSSSFAWFTVSQASEVTNVKVEMQAQKNLEIAVGSTAPSEVNTGDAGKLNKWGSSVNYAAAGVTLTQMATVADGAVKTVSYDATGRVDQLVAATVATTGTDAGTSDVSATGGATPTTYKDANNKICAAEYNIWLRSNSITSVTAKVEATTFGDGMTVYVDGNAITANNGTATITLVANEPKNVKIVVLVDGTTHYASDVAAGKTFEGKITFAETAAAPGP